MELGEKHEEVRKAKDRKSVFSFRKRSLGVVSVIYKFSAGKWRPCLGRDSCGVQVGSADRIKFSR